MGRKGRVPFESSALMKPDGGIARASYDENGKRRVDGLLAGAGDLALSREPVTACSRAVSWVA